MSEWTRPFLTRSYGDIRRAGRALSRRADTATTHRVTEWSE